MLVLLWPATSTENQTVLNENEIREKLEQLGIEPHTFTKFETHNVPRQKALTRIQFEESQKLWPVLFHEDKTQVVLGNFYSEYGT